ncbi:two-component regulator propeller domain-containing protein [Limibacter armeniacum]|uniref:hybrid sensor histidine kinase/response regulator transcription factor n=1 Tax=Limibacter armeniacum TaxID=466084 RepID=UPI002FE5E289
MPYILRQLLKTILLLPIIGFIISSCFAQVPYSISHYSVEEGLAQSTVYAIAQDQQGFMWFGTRGGGLNRFDGKDFVHYMHVPQDSSTIPHNIVTALSIGANHQIWVGTANGICQFDIKSETSRPYPETMLENGKENFTNCLFRDSKGHLFAGTNNGLMIYNNQTDHFELLANESSNVRAIAEDSKGNIWYTSTYKGLVCYNPSTQESTTFQSESNNTEGLNGSNLLTVAVDFNDHIWVGTRSAGISVLEDPANKKFRHYRKGTLPSDDVRVIVQDQHKNLWIGTKEGVARYDHFDKTFQVFKQGNGLTNTLSQNSVYSIFEDNKQNMWVGTWSGGVNFFSTNARKFYPITHFDTSTGLAFFGSVSSFWADSSSVLIGTEGNGLIRKNGEQYNIIKPNGNRSESILHPHVKALMKDSNGNLWVGQYKGLSRQDAQTKRFTHLLENEGIYSITEYPKGKVWVSCSRSIYLIENGKISAHYNYENGNLHESYNRGGVFHISHLGEIWVGSQNGLLKYNPRDDIFETFTPSKQSYFNSFVYSIAEDQENRLWVGTQNGLYGLNTKDSTLVHYSTAEGLSSHIINGLVYDDRENALWISTAKGINQLMINTGKVNAFYSSEGLQGDEFNRNACFQASDDNIYFGGTNGFNVFRPYEIAINHKAPNVILNKISFLGNKSIDKQESLKLMDKESISIQYGQAILAIDYTAINYSQPEQVTYAIRMKGYIDDWLYLDKQRTANFARLSPGNYNFEVKAANEDGVWGEATVLAIEILPPLWRSWWANLLYLLLAAIMVQLVYKEMRVRKQFKEDLLVEKMDKEKVSHINQLKINFFTNISHELRTPLSLIIGPLDRLIRKGESIPADHEYLKLMLKNAKQLMQLVDELLEFRKIQSSKQPLRIQQVKAVDFLKELCLAFEARAESKKIALEVLGESDISLWLDKGKIQKVIQNLVGNAFKFTPEGGRIQVMVEDTGENVLLRVFDTGKGMSEVMQQRVFEYYSQEQSTLVEEKGFGIGMALTKELVELHHGSITVSSEEGKGTTFCISLPKGKTHFADEELAQETHTVKVQETLEPLGTEGKKTLLLADDNAEFRTFMKSGLEEDFQIVEASDGAEAFELAKTHLPDIILTDIMMPETDGYALCSMVKEHKKTNHIPVVMLSAKNATESRKIALQNGADAYVSKPFDWEHLTLTLQTTIQKYYQIRRSYLKDLLSEEEQHADEVSEEDKFSIEVKRIMEEYLSDPDLSVDTFCKEIGMSRSNLNIRFKHVMERPPSEYIKYYRMQKAAALLSTGKHSVIEVVYSVGFKSPSYFTKCFKEHFGSLPSEFVEASSLH